MGGRFGTKLPPPAAMTMTGAMRTLPVSVVRRHLPSMRLVEGGGHLAEMKDGLERGDLLEQPVGQLLAGADRDARNVIDRLLRIKLGALPAGPVENVHDLGFQLGKAELEDGEQAHRARANNNYVGRGLARRHRHIARSLKVPLSIWGV